MLEYFRHSIIRSVAAGFGTLFNNIYIARFDSDGNEVKRIRVPLAYGPKQKFIVRIEQADPELIHRTESYLPRMGYELVGFEYDSSRKLQTTKKIPGISLSTAHELRYEKVPYNLIFNLHVLTKNTEDAFQILEQILPYFGPDFCISFKNFPIDERADVPINIVSVSTTEEYEGNFEERKVYIITIAFVAKANLYGPVNTSKIILESDINMVDFDEIKATGTTTGPSGMEYVTYGITGATFATVVVGPTGGATAGSIGPTGTYYVDITEYPNN